MSISVDTAKKDALPSIPAVSLILDKFGMPPLDKSINVYVEPFRPGNAAIDTADTNAAINVISRLGR